MRYVITLKGIRASFSNMDILFIGGTSFVGRHAAEAAIARGHTVTLFHRGRTGADLFPGSEHINGDRDTALGLLAGRTWDAAVDVCAYVPRQVEQAAGVLAGSVASYCYVSSVSAYRPLEAPLLDEDAALYGPGDLEDPGTELVDEVTYGPLKALGEVAAKAGFGADVLIVRPTYVIGPDDISDRFTYWARRAAAGGEILAAGPAAAPIQLIDVRDLGAFIIRLLERGATGPFNVVGPETPLTWAGMLDTCISEPGSTAAVTWADPEFLRQHGVRVTSEIPFWRGPEEFVRMRCDPGRSLAAGLSLRPLRESVRDTRAWDVARGSPEVLDAISSVREQHLLEEWRRSRGASG